MTIIYDKTSSDDEGVLNRLHYNGGVCRVKFFGPSDESFLLEVGPDGNWTNTLEERVTFVSDRHIATRTNPASFWILIFALGFLKNFV
jgi:hypothetical protein